MHFAAIFPNSLVMLHSREFSLTLLLPVFAPHIILYNFPHKQPLNTSFFSSLCLPPSFSSYVFSPSHSLSFPPYLPTHVAIPTPRIQSYSILSVSLSSPDTLRSFHLLTLSLWVSIFRLPLIPYDLIINYYGILPIPNNNSKSPCILILHESNNMQNIFIIAFPSFLSVSAFVVYWLSIFPLSFPPSLLSLSSPLPILPFVSSHFYFSHSSFLLALSFSPYLFFHDLTLPLHPFRCSPIFSPHNLFLKLLFSAFFWQALWRPSVLSLL